MITTGDDEGVPSTRQNRVSSLTLPSPFTFTKEIDIMTRFQDKTEQEQREEVRGLILMYAKSNGDPVPREEGLTAAVNQIMKTTTGRAPAGPVVSTGGKV